MYTCDKEKIGKFIFELRKEQHLTQKELAEKLMVSNKTISKWENGSGLPDISMLVPLSSALGITVTELLKGERFAKDASVDLSSVDDLLKTTLHLTQKEQENFSHWKSKNILLFLLCSIICLLENGFLYYRNFPFAQTGGVVLTLSLLSFCFAGYFTLFAKQRIPAFYDENPISFYTDGFMKLSLPGVHFKNSNWLPIVRTFCISCCSLMILIPLIFGVSFLWKFPGWNIVSDIVSGIGFFTGMFLPVYLVAKKYE